RPGPGAGRICGLRLKACWGRTSGREKGRGVSMTDLAIPAPDMSRHGQRGERPEGRIKLGSAEHLRLFCLELLETHDPYRPRILDWPKLDDDTRGKLVSL